MIARRQGEVILTPIVKLSKLRGIDKLGEASEEVEEIRKEWDEDFEKGIKEL